MTVYYFNSVKCAITDAFVNGRLNRELVQRFKSTKSRDILYALNRTGRLTKFEVLRILCIVRYYKVALSILNDAQKRSLDVRSNYSVEVCVRYASDQVNFISLDFRESIVKCAEEFDVYNRPLIKSELQNSDTLTAMKILADHIKVDAACCIFGERKLIEPTQGLYDKYVRPDEEWQYYY